MIDHRASPAAVVSYRASGRAVRLARLCQRPPGYLPQQDGLIKLSLSRKPMGSLACGHSFRNRLVQRISFYARIAQTTQPGTSWQLWWALAGAAAAVHPQWDSRCVHAQILMELRPMVAYLFNSEASKAIWCSAGAFRGEAPVAP